MAHRVRLHELAEADLAGIYDAISDVAGPAIAGDYVAGIYDFIERFAIFPERGTVRPGPVPGLRIIGYRHTASVAFVVEDDLVTILGVFRRGQDISPEMIKRRL